VFLLQGADELLEPFTGNQFLHLVQMIGNLSLVTAARFTGSKRHEFFPIAFEICNRIDTRDWIAFSNSRP